MRGDTPGAIRALQTQGTVGDRQDFEALAALVTEVRGMTSNVRQQLQCDNLIAPRGHIVAKFSAPSRTSNATAPAALLPDQPLEQRSALAARNKSSKLLSSVVSALYEFTGPPTGSAVPRAQPTTT